MLEIRDLGYINAVPHIRYNGLDKYINLSKIEPLTNGPFLKIDPKICVVILQEIAIKYPIPFTACKIQYLSSIINASYNDEDSLVEFRGDRKLGLGRVLKEMLEAREFLEKGGKYKFNFQTEENILSMAQSRHLSINHAIFTEVIKIFYNVIKDMRWLYTDTKAYVFDDNMTINIYDLIITNDEIKPDFKSRKLLMLKDIEDQIVLYNDLKNGVYLTNMSSIEIVSGTNILTIEKIEKLSKEFA